MRYLHYIGKNAKIKIMNIRMAAFLIVMLLITIKYQRPLKAFSADMNYPCSPWVFPFLMTRDVYSVIFYFAAIYVNCDLPFMQYSNIYTLNRLGRRKWVAAQMCAAALRSFAMVLVTLLCSVITLLPRIEWTLEWGKLMHTMASTDIAAPYFLEYAVFPKALSNFSPLELTAICVMIITLITVFLTFLMYAVCLYGSRIAAVVAAVGLSIMLFFVQNLHVMLQIGLSMWVPTIWAQVARVYDPKLGNFYLPSVSYMVIWLAIAILILSFLIIYKIKHVDFNWEKEDI